MNSFLNSVSGEKQEKFLGSEEAAQMTQNAEIPQLERNENIQQNLKTRNKQEICGVHLNRSSERMNLQNNSDVGIQEKPSKYSHSASQIDVPSKLHNFSEQIDEIEENEEVPDRLKISENTNNITVMDLNVNELSLNKNRGVSVQNSDSKVIVSDNRRKASPSRNAADKVESLSPFHKTVSASSVTVRNNVEPSPINCPISSPNEKPKVVWSQSPYNSHSLHSDSSSHDNEADFKCLTYMQSLRTNQSIYKLAYDESMTDQSEADSRSPSPVDPETQVPKSIINDEILIHEADSCSDAGSEDVELIPHRYESETFLHESKHMYVNKLSLAVELLRTHESLPYDEQFKRVSGQSELNSKEEAIGEVNRGFVDESSSFDGLDKHDKSLNVITSESQTKNHSNSAEMSSFSFQDTCEEAKEVVVETSNTRDNSEGVRAGYRRFQVQFHHYFTPRAALVNPCLCCIIM